MSSIWNVGPLNRELIESREYTDALASIGNLERLDDALTGVCWALSTNPEVYDVVKGFSDIRIIKTDALGGLPAMRIWFRIDEDGRHVHLEFIEPIQED